MIETVNITKFYASDDQELLHTLRWTARVALHMKNESNLLNILSAYEDALKLLQRDARSRGYFLMGTESVQNFIKHHPISCLYGERIATLTKTGGLANVNTTSLSDTYCNSVSAVERMRDGERVSWYVPGCIEPGTPEWTAHYTLEIGKVDKPVANEPEIVSSNERVLCLVGGGKKIHLANRGEFQSLCGTRGSVFPIEKAVRGTSLCHRCSDPSMRSRHSVVVSDFPANY